MPIRKTHGTRPSSASSVVNSAGASAFASDQDSWYTAMYRPRTAVGAADTASMSAAGLCTNSPTVTTTTPPTSAAVSTAAESGRAAASASWVRKPAAKSRDPSAAARVRRAPVRRTRRPT